MYYKKYIHYRSFPPPAAAALSRRWYRYECDDYPYLYRPPYYTYPYPYMYYPIIETPGELISYYDRLRTEFS